MTELTRASPQRPNRKAGNLVVQLAAELRRAIEAGEFRPGDRLPSEAGLTAAHGVSRTVVREAIAALRADGLVEARQGAGVFVLPPPPAAPAPFQGIDVARISSVIEVLELRTAVEAEAAALAALRRSPAQEETLLRRHHAVIEALRAGRPTAEADFALHLAIAEATNNPRFVEFLTMMGPAIIPRLALQDGAASDSEAYIARIHAEHGQIVEAIANGDAEAAREAMRHHLRSSQARYRALQRRMPDNT
ncbi:transcriptional regulator, GntR family [Rubellimicrobium thermophilum DSM 16684]|uniref:Transcriptional regulator, GntR family n=1 Tax=Rubellimicrobium thermophilum DSM 16684 TaxID=1123069 RepID=S9R6Z2_9RHOB|nr:FadR/GntR family transcriptional regulator [Rubellimicrobium thermophilum]EPX87642.1 transcriptional regulator, GntR family [Rubellimicrobium thermophilum DSM 16684]